VFRENRFFRNVGIFAKLRNSRKSSLIFAKHENRFVASFAKFSRNEILSKTLLARWRWRQGESLQLPKKEVANVASFINCHDCYTAVAQQSFHKQCAFMLSILEVVRPGGARRWQPLIVRLAATKWQKNEKPYHMLSSHIIR
jgi:hypothetical protein